MASSASLPSSAEIWKYDVFLSFRGPDTRRSITSQLYDMLQNKSGIKTFIDDSDLEVGDPISILWVEYTEFQVSIMMKIMYFGFLIHFCYGRLFDPCFFLPHTTDGELVTEIVDFVCGKVQPIDIEFTMCTGDFGVYEATRKAKKEVMVALEDDEVTAIGVYGMGGVGKTTMVEHVAAQARKKGTFDHVVMAVVSQRPNIERIQLTLLAKLLGHQNFPEIGRASRLYKEIMRKKNVLIILDDIWGFIDLPRIGIPSHDELRQCNSRVLITTRRSHMCSSMKSQAIIPLDILSEKDSWSLFLKKTERSFESTNFVEVAKQVAGECKGLPIALIAVARALRDKDVEEWQKAAEQLKKSEIANPDHEDDAYRCFLNDKNYKTCFLLCCLFPEDEDIPIEGIFKYTM